MQFCFTVFANLIKKITFIEHLKGCLKVLHTRLGFFITFRKFSLLLLLLPTSFQQFFVVINIKEDTTQKETIFIIKRIVDAIRFLCTDVFDREDKSVEIKMLFSVCKVDKYSV